MPSKYIWQYRLEVPVDSVDAANKLAPGLGNPGGIEASFQRYPAMVFEDWETPAEDQPPVEYWYATFLAVDKVSDGSPSLEGLESILNSAPEDSPLKNIRWWRYQNPHHPDSHSDEVISSNSL